jgi:membrane fusion protein
MASIVALFAILLATGSYARSERVNGYLVPSKGMVRIQPGHFGVLERLYVKEGDVVRTGQRLASIALTQDTGDARSPIGQSAEALQLQQAQLDSQIALEAEQRVTQAGKLRAEQGELEAAVQSLVAQLQLQRQVVASSGTTYTRAAALADKGYVTKIEVEQRYQTWLAHQAQQKKIEQDLAQARAQFQQNELGLRQLPLDSSQRIARLRQERLAVGERTGELQGRRMDEIVSPVAGRVVTIIGPSPGGTVSPGQPFITILPVDSILRAELFVPSRAAGFLRPGQDVKLLYDAFPYQRFGSYPAVVSSVGQNILSPEEVIAPFKVTEAVYRVTADVRSPVIVARGQRISLQSGMTLKANVVLERRSFLDWFLEPLRALGARS